MEGFNWQETASATVATAVVAVAGGMLAWLRGSYKRFKSMDNRLGALESMDKHLQALHDFARESEERMKRMTRRLRLQDRKLTDHHHRLRKIEDHRERCGE
jgi:hypothetical protein